MQRKSTTKKTLPDIGKEQYPRRRRTIVKRRQGEPGLANSTKAVKGKKLRPGDLDRIDRIEVRAGSTNVYADLGFADAGERFAKLKLALQVNQIIENNGWSQTVAARKLGTQQPEISNLKRGRLRSITYDRLMGWLLILGYSVEIRVQKARKPHLEVAVAG